MTISELDREVSQEINRIERAIEKWVKSKGLWGDCGFFKFTEHKDAPPWTEHPVVTIFGSEGDFNNVFHGSDELYEEFVAMLDRNGYWFERDTCTVYVLSADEAMNEKFKDYFDWQWICSLLKPDFNDIHHELFRHFEKNPEALLKLGWRDFEVLIYELFRHQGYKVELGPGRGDGGIDMTLLQTDPIGDILTAVQVKRYRHRPIDLQAIQALHGAADANELQNTTFVTTSRYLPSAKEFAQRENVGMKLFLSDDVVKWCKHAHRGIIKDKNRLFTRGSIEKILSAARNNPKEYIVHAHTGYSVMTNSFALKLKESKHAALLLELPNVVISHDGHKLRGLEVPELEVFSVLSAFSKPAPIGVGNVSRAKKYIEDDYGYCFWTGENSYRQWNGEPVPFDILD